MIIMIDDEKRWVQGYKDALEDAGYKCELISNLDELDSLFDVRDGLKFVELIILDIMMAPHNRYSEDNTEDGMRTGEYVLADINRSAPGLPVLILTNKNIDNCVKETSGGYELYLLKKDVPPSKLIHIVNDILNRR